MKSKNALIVAITIGFIVLYQIFVLGPYTEQKLAYEKAQKAKQEQQTTSAPSLGATDVTPESQTTTSTNQGAQTSQSSAPAESTTTASGPLKNPKRLTIIEVGATRSVELFEGGTLGVATLKTFYEREAFVKGVKNPIELNREGLYWYSSNPQIQSCINSMGSREGVLRGDDQTLYLKGQNGEALCQLTITQDGVHDGLMGLSLSLEGFESSPQDIVELRGSGGLGSKNQLDQNFLSYRLEDEIENMRGEDVFVKTSARGLLKWMTWGDKYFSLIFTPQGNYNPDLFFGVTQNPDSLDQTNAKTQYALRYPAVPERGKDRFDFDMSFYFGARSTTVLNDIDPELVETVDLGFFASVARLMLWSLEHLNKWFLNYGVSIIVLTLIVRAIFWPLNKKAYQSQAKMKEIQPEMERIRKKYDTKDRAQMEKMNKEIFAMYRDKKVNPLGGCLPLFLQMPILIGLYGGLSNSIELYQAPFFAWIKDLSLPDPYYVLPISWTLSLLGYMKINPQAMNTTQPGMPNMKWMFIGMNLFFGFLSKDWPAGLVLYLLVSNVVGLTQQYFIQRNIKQQKVATEGA